MSYGRKTLIRNGMQRCAIFWVMWKVRELDQWVVLVLGKWKPNKFGFKFFLGNAQHILSVKMSRWGLSSRSVSERVQERGWMTENHLNEFGMGHPTLSWRVPRFQQKSHEFLRTSWKSLWISDVKKQLWNLSGRNSLPSWWRTPESVLHSSFFDVLFLKKNYHFFFSVFVSLW